MCLWDCLQAPPAPQISSRLDCLSFLRSRHSHAAFLSSMPQNSSNKLPLLAPCPPPSSPLHLHGLVSPPPLQQLFAACRASFFPESLPLPTNYLGLPPPVAGKQAMAA
ncbi:hypothetical protein HDV62DRAFT_120666 [Trichoderma sp. SZMC 28011]